MNTCDNCQNAFYTGGQIEKAKKKGVTVESLRHKFCVLYHFYTSKKQTCAEFETKTVEENEPKGTI